MLLINTRDMSATFAGDDMFPFFIVQCVVVHVIVTQSKLVLVREYIKYMTVPLWDRVVLALIE